MTDYFGIVRWCEEDLCNVLREHGIPFTDENLSALLKSVDTHWFKDAMIDAGWNYIDDCADCLFIDDNGSKIVSRIKLPVENKMIKITEEDICDIICAALEGGIGYWACLDNRDNVWHSDENKHKFYSEIAADILLHDGAIRFLDAEDHLTVQGTITFEKLINGIRMYLAENQDVVDFENLYIDTSNIDCEAADMIFQYAMFGDIVYG